MTRTKQQMIPVYDAALTLTPALLPGQPEGGYGSPSPWYSTKKSFLHSVGTVFYNMKRCKLSNHLAHYITCLVFEYQALMQCVNNTASFVVKCF